MSISKKGSTCGNSPMTQWSLKNHPQLNPTKVKEICTCLKCTPPCFSQVSLEGVEFEVVSTAKVLGVIISSNLKWSAHINSLTTKAAKRLYLLGQLKCVGIANTDLVRFHCSAIRLQSTILLIPKWRRPMRVWIE